MKSDRRELWFLFPLYGLELSDDEGFDDPIWGWATLVSANFVEDTICRIHDSEDDDYLRELALWDAGVITSDQTEHAPINPGGNSSEIEVDERSPHSYVAVRHTVNLEDVSETFEKLLPLAQQITALLSLTLRNQHPDDGIPALGFDARPVPSRGFAAISDDGEAFRSTRQRPDWAVGVFYDPLRTTKTSVYESFENNIPIRVCLEIPTILMR